MTEPLPSPREMTRLLAAWSEGDREALERLLPLVEAAEKLESLLYSKKGA